MIFHVSWAAETQVSEKEFLASLFYLNYCIWKVAIFVGEFSDT
jgi:hypothetical protein